MAYDATDIRVGANGQVYVAPITAAAPTSTVSVLDTLFVDIGFVSEEGVMFVDQKELTDVTRWKQALPDRRIVTSRTMALQMVLRELSAQTIEFALGGTVNTSGAEFTYTPPAPLDQLESSVILDWVDGPKRYRLYIPRGVAVSNVGFSINRQSPTELPLTFVALATIGADPYTVWLDDNNFA